MNKKDEMVVKWWQKLTANTVLCNHNKNGTYMLSETHWKHYSGQLKQCSTTKTRHRQLSVTA